MFKQRSLKSVLFIAVAFGSFSAFLQIVPYLWREISEKDALKQTLNIASWAPLVDKSKEAVVVITTEAMVEQPTLEFPGLPGPFRFFVPMPPEKQRGQGSGFIINEEGYIITNQHVIEGAQKIRVKVGTKPREFDAIVVGADEALDIALIKIKTEENEKIKWPYLPLGDSDKLRLGDPVMAMGSPLGLVQSVNTGIISQKQRGGIRPSGRNLDIELIQMQMPINPGNSGGPILDVSGRVVGVSESILASGQAIAFCVPINIIKAMIPQLLQNGQIDKAFLGVEPTDLTPQYAKALGLSENETGAIVVQVMPHTPAEKAGLKPMDVILEIDGIKIIDQFNLRQHTAYKGIGQTVKVKLFRKGEGIKFINVKLEKRAASPNQFARPTKESHNNVTIDSVGLELIDTPPQIRKELGISEKSPGAQVIGVARRSAAEFSSLQPGDVITEINGVLIKSAEQVRSIIEKAKKDSTLMMLTRRAPNTKRFVPLEK